MSGKIISFYETREGLGQSIIGLNFAIALRSQSGQEVAVCDFNFDTAGEVPLLLNSSISKTLQDVLPVMSALDARSIKGYLTKHSSGIAVLPGFSGTEPAAQISPEILEVVSGYLREAYPWTVMLSEKSFNDRLLSIFDSSDLVFLIVSPHLLSLNQAKGFLNKLKALHFPVQIVRLLVNMSDIKAAVSKAEIEKFLGQKVFAEVPYDSSAVIPSINEGSPLVLSNPHSKVSVAVKELAKLVLSENEKYEKEKSGIFMDREKNKTKAGEGKKLVEEAPELIPESSGPAELVRLKEKIHKRLIENYDIKSLDMKDLLVPGKMDKLRTRTREKIENLLVEEGGAIYDRAERSRIIEDLLNEVLGFGVLEEFLKDEKISEIMVNGPDNIYLEKGGKIVLTEKHFDNANQLLTVIDRILAPIGRRVDESSPLVDARLPDGSRVNIIIPPLSLVGPCITIRKFTAKKLGLEDLIGMGSITAEMIDFLRIAVGLRKNIIISGGTGSGKTTLLNMVSSFISDTERILTIEDSAELKLNQKHTITLESKPPSIEGTGEIPIRRLVINALRMRPDRIVVGECRGGETLDMLQAMNTGHDGSLTTLHSNSPKDTISRLTTMVIMAGTELPEKAIREQIIAAIHLVVQISRFSDGSRKITNITEVVPGEKGEVALKDLFIFRQTSLAQGGKVQGNFEATGELPSFYEEITVRGLNYDKNNFQKKVLRAI